MYVIYNNEKIIKYVENATVAITEYLKRKTDDDTVKLVDNFDDAIELIKAIAYTEGYEFARYENLQHDIAISGDTILPINHKTGN